MSDIRIIRSSKDTDNNPFKGSKVVKCPECQAVQMFSSYYHQPHGFMFLKLRKVSCYSCPCGCKFEKITEA